MNLPWFSRLSFCCRFSSIMLILQVFLFRRENLNFGDTFQQFGIEWIVNYYTEPAVLFIILQRAVNLKFVSRFYSGYIEGKDYEPGK